MGLEPGFWRVVCWYNWQKQATIVELSPLG